MGAWRLNYNIYEKKYNDAEGIEEYWQLEALYTLTHSNRERRQLSGFKGFKFKSYGYKHTPE